MRTVPAGILLLALLPPSIKQDNRHQLVYQAILDHMKAEGAFSGFQIYDAYLKECRNYAIEFGFVLEDLKGLPYPLCCKTTGSKVGIDPWCTQVGVKINTGGGGATVYFTAITMLPLDSPIRKQFKTEFSEAKAVQALWNANAPAKLTIQQAIDSGRRAGGKTKDDEPYFDVSVFHKVLDWDVYNNSIYDLAHGMANNIRDLFQMVFNFGDRAFNDAKRVFEMDTLGRFQNYGTREVMPWMAPRKVKAKLKQLLSSGILKVPVGCPEVQDITAKIPYKISDKLNLAGDFGKWVLGLCELEAEHFVSELILKQYSNNTQTVLKQYSNNTQLVPN